MSGLQGLMPGTIAAYNALEQYGQTVGITFTIAPYGGLRTQSDTTKILGYRQDDYNAALAAGTIRPDTTLQQFRPIAPFGSSYHNYGAAFDVWITSTPQGTAPDSWTQAPGFENARRVLAAFAPSIGLRWGGTFPNPDPPHFEVAVPLTVAQSMYKQFLADGGSASSSAFDLSSFGIGPEGDDAAAATDIPASQYAGDDSGDAALAAPQQSPTLLLIGFAVAGLLTWLIRRKLR